MKIADYMNALPDSFEKRVNYNNYKLLLLECTSTEGLREDLEGVWNTTDLSKCFGKTLDLYGEIYQQPRGSLTDSQYRIVIMQKVAQYMTGGDYNSTVSNIAAALGVDVSTISLKEDDELSCVIEIVDLPYSVLLNAGITEEQAYQMLSAMMPAGVYLVPLSLTGTFEFGDNSLVYDEEKGFGNIAQTIGGYFGKLGTSDVNIPN